MAAKYGWTARGSTMCLLTQPSPGSSYDLQHTEQYRDVMTFVSPESGNRCSVSWLLPRSDDDLFLTHALGDPQVDHSEQPQNARRAEREEDLALHVVEETPEGIIVTGGKQLATAAPIGNETYVSLSATFARRSDPKFVLACSIATNSPGMKILCREPVSLWSGSYGHPLGAPYDKQDSMLFFDNVLVPWDRVFMLYESGPLLRDFAAGINFTEWANLCRIHERMKLMTAVATMIAEAIGVLEYREVAAKVGEMVTYTEMWRHAMDGVEHGAQMDYGGGPWARWPA